MSRSTVLELAADVVEQLPHIVRATREATGQTKYGLEQQIGVARATLTAVEGGSGCHSSTAATLLRWAATA